jgi:heme A synthase
MESHRVTTVLSVAGIWIQYLTAASVVYLDPNNNTFPYTTIVLSWPGVLEEIHRVWALAILVILVLNVFLIRKAKQQTRPLMLLALAVLGLFVLQASFGAITIWNYDYPPYVIMHEGNAGLLLFVCSVLGAYVLAMPANATSHTIRKTK